MSSLTILLSIGASLLQYSLGDDRTLSEPSPGVTHYERHDYATFWNVGSAADEVSTTGESTQPFIWHATNFHRDPSYTEGSGCSAPYALVETYVKALKDKGSKPNFIIYSGDFNDSPSHEKNSSGLDSNCVISLLQSVIDTFKAHFPDTPLVLGATTNNYYPGGSSNYLSHTVAEAWRNWLGSNEALETFRKGAYYTRLVLPDEKVRVVVANMNLYLSSNEAAHGETDPGDQMAWLRDVLNKARSNSERVHFVANAANDALRWQTNVHSTKFNGLIRDFADVITGIHSSHGELDGFWKQVTSLSLLMTSPRPAESSKYAIEEGTIYTQGETTEPSTEDSTIYTQGETIEPSTEDSTIYTQGETIEPLTEDSTIYTPGETTEPATEDSTIYAQEETIEPSTEDSTIYTQGESTDTSSEDSTFPTSAKSSFRTTEDSSMMSTQHAAGVNKIYLDYSHGRPINIEHFHLDLSNGPHEAEWKKLNVFEDAYNDGGIMDETKQQGGEGLDMDNTDFNEPCDFLCKLRRICAAKYRTFEWRHSGVTGGASACTIHMVILLISQLVSH